MGKVGRPPFEITQEVLEKVESYAARGLTQEQIADALGIATSTLCNKKNEFEEFLEAIKRGKAKGIALVADKLLENVKNANVTAQIFYLKCQAKWKETEVIEHTGKDGEAILIDTKRKLAEDEINKIYSQILKQENKE